MSAATPPAPPNGQPVETACGSPLAYSPDIPQTVHDDRRIYFCLPACLRDFETDPVHSCLAENPTFANPPNS